ncbi:MAG: hypothetical protein PUE60_03505 [Eubacteriales bacterium]|nr:hypothetical protein [Eubacteriales bacterium]
MDYITAWEKLGEFPEKQKSQMLHTFNNPYGFRLNINHPMVLPKYEAFKKKNNIGRYDMTDELRDKFEKQFMASKYYQKLIEAEQKKYGPAYDYIYEPLVG